MAGGTRGQGRTSRRFTARRDVHRSKGDGAQIGSRQCSVTFLV